MNDDSPSLHILAIVVAVLVGVGTINWYVDKHHPTFRFSRLIPTSEDLQNTAGEQREFHISVPISYVAATLGIPFLAMMASTFGEFGTLWSRVFTFALVLMYVLVGCSAVWAIVYLYLRSRLFIAGLLFVLAIILSLFAHNGATLVRSEGSAVSWVEYHDASPEARKGACGCALITLIGFFTWVLPLAGYMVWTGSW
jgi:DMSO reductase anchor subunit